MMDVYEGVMNKLHEYGRGRTKIALLFSANDPNSSLPSNSSLSICRGSAHVSRGAKYLLPFRRITCAWKKVRRWTEAQRQPMAGSLYYWFRTDNQ